MNLYPVWIVPTLLAVVFAASIANAQSNDDTSAQDIASAIKAVQAIGANARTTNRQLKRFKS